MDTNHFELIQSRNFDCDTIQFNDIIHRIINLHHTFDITYIGMFTYENLQKYVRLFIEHTYWAEKKNSKWKIFQVWPYSITNDLGSFTRNESNWHKHRPQAFRNSFVYIYNMHIYIYIKALDLWRQKNWLDINFGWFNICFDSNTIYIQRKL